MAEKQFALGGTRSAGYVEDEDPLAELARIVGFQEQPAVMQRPEAPAANARREPVLAEFPVGTPNQPAIVAGPNPVADLEDELLRAFEIYDAPRSETVPPPAVNMNQPGPRVEPVAVVESPRAIQVAPAMPDEDEDPFAALAAVVAAQPATPRAAPQYAQVRREPSFEEIASIDAQPVAEEFPSEASVEYDEPAISVDLLEQELLESLEEADIATPAPAVTPEPIAQIANKGRQHPPSFRSDGSFQLPLAASFYKPAPQPVRVEPVVARTTEEPALFAEMNANAPASEQEVSWDLPGIEADDMVVVDPPAAFATAGSPQGAGSMDALLDDVARYEVPSARPAAVQPRDPAFMASLAAITGVATKIGQPVEDVPAQSLRRDPEPAWQAEAADYSSAGDEPNLDDLFGPGDFELDLDAFEQQLTELAHDENVRAEPQQHANPDTSREPFAEFIGETEAHGAAQVAPEIEAPYRERQHFDPVEQPSRKPESQIQSFVAERRERVSFDETNFDFGSMEPEIVSEPVRREPVAAAPMSIRIPDYTIDENAPFDPAMLAESEDAVEALGEIDVPEIRVEIEEEPAVSVPEYDLDIDAEMANLFGSLPPVNQSQQGARSVASGGNTGNGRADPMFGGARQQAAPQSDAFDEFERALEDDFRSMLTQPLGQPQASHGHGHGSPLMPQEAYKSRSDRGTLRAVLLAACATGVLALGGVGAYYFLSGDVTEIASNEPRIIAADRGPVKVIPDNPGGVTVPNQDKAVYDRVAGKEADVVKQGALMTTDEEPVDVVQKTLVPDNAFDAESEPEAQAPVSTPVEDTQDARLLPANGATQPEAAATEQSNTPGGVAVRKVRTMIVKPDGTLVPREDTAEAQPADGAAGASGTAAALPAANATAAATAPAEITPPAPAANDLRVADEANAPATDQAASAEALASVANSDVQVQPPVNTVKTTRSGDTAPIPQARPSDQPVNVTSTVTENGNVRPAAEATQQVAAAQPETQPAPAAPTGSYGIQIASLPSEADAKASIPKMSAKFSGVLGGRNIGIRKADIPGKGTYYRLRVDVGSKEDAVNLCLQLKAAGGSCLVSR